MLDGILHVSCLSKGLTHKILGRGEAVGNDVRNMHSEGTVDLAAELADQWDECRLVLDPGERDLDVGPRPVRATLSDRRVVFACGALSAPDTDRVRTPQLTHLQPRSTPRARRLRRWAKGGAVCSASELVGA